MTSLLHKLSRIALTPPVCAISMAIGISAAAFADDYYVSSDGNYGIEEGADADHRFTDLQAAVAAFEAAKVDSTIWVKGGYTYKNRIEYKTGFFTCVKVTSTKKLLIRGESGDWADGPVICGSHMTGASATDRATWCGEGAATCFVGAGTAYTTLLGIRLEGGATQAADGQYGGGALNAMLRNCLVANCAAYQRGGGTSGCNTYDCAVTNCYCARGSNTYGGGHYAGIHSNDFIFACYCKNQGGGVRSTTCYDCIITNCTAGSYGGSACSDTLYRCKLYGGTATNGGGASYQGTLWDCEIYSCDTALYTASAYGCVISNCTGSNGSGFYFKDGNIASNCTFVANASPSIGVVSANTKNLLIDCKILDNLGHGIQLADKNRSTFLVVSNCTVEGVNISSCAVNVQQSTEKGKTGLTQILRAYNSVFKGPIAGSGDFYNCLITGASSSTLPTVFCNASRATNMDGLVIPLNLYNCTVINNVSTYSTAGNVAGGYVNAYNTIIRDNTAPAGKADELATAVNCCLSDTATAMTETDCIRVDPALYLGTSDYFYPSASSPCRTAGSLTAYELTPTDQAGQPRTSNGGTTVAIGACEFDPTFVGASIVCLPEITKAPATGKFTVTYSGLGENLTFSWDFNGDGTVDLVTNVATVAYYYPEAGDYRAKVAVSDGQKTVTAEQAMSILDGYFVSTKNIHEVPGRTGGWGVYTTDDGHEHLAYTNLQQAIDAAGAGDIVWVDNDFVCDEGVAGNNARINIQKVLTVRGHSGDGGTGPVIRGAYHTADTPCGANAVRCVYANSKDVHLIGLRLVGGATQAAANVPGSGGGAYNCTLENCRVEDCHAYNYGGGVRDCNTKDCLFERCEVSGAAINYGGGAYSGFHDGSVFVACSGGQGGGVRSGEVVDCVFTNCSATHGAAVAAGVSARRCVFYGGTILNGGRGCATYMQPLYDCWIKKASSCAISASDAYGCIVEDSLNSVYGSALALDGASVVSNCTFVGNASPVVRTRTSSAAAVLMYCTFSNNLGNVIRVADNQSNCRLTLRHCTILCTNASNKAVYAERYDEKSAYASEATVENCVIMGLVSGPGSYYNCLITGVTNATSPVVQCNADQATYTGVNSPLRLYNCTVTGNHAKQGAVGAGGGYVEAYNSIVRGNVSEKGVADEFAVADRSCLANDATATTESLCVRCNPRFMGTPGDEYVPRAAKLYGKGQIFDWMSDPEDVRSQDLAGKPRLHEGAVDMGAFAMYPLPGFLLLVR